MNLIIPCILIAGALSSGFASNNFNRFSDMRHETFPLTRQVSFPNLMELRSYKASSLKPLSPRQVVADFEKIKTRYMSERIDFDAVFSFHTTFKVDTPRGDSQNIFQILPNNVTKEMLKKASLMDVLSFAQTCNTGRSLALSDSVWRDVVPNFDSTEGSTLKAKRPLSGIAFSYAISALHELTQKIGEKENYILSNQNFKRSELSKAMFKPIIVEGHDFLKIDGYKIKCSDYKCQNCSEFIVYPMSKLRAAASMGFDDVNYLIDHLRGEFHRAVYFLSMITMVKKAWETPWLLKVAIDRNIPQVSHLTQHQKQQLLDSLSGKLRKSEDLEVFAIRSVKSPHVK